MFISRDAQTILGACAGNIHGSMNGSACHRISTGFTLAVMATLIVFLPVGTKAAVNVSINTAAAPSLQDQFIADATNQYFGTLTKSPYFANTYSFVITGKKPTAPTVAVPCTLDESIKEIIQVTTSSYVYGFASGMDSERYSDIQSIYGIQAQEAIGKTCGGTPVSVLTSSSAVLGACVQAYNLAVSTISQRWQYIYTPLGVRVE